MKCSNKCCFCCPHCYSAKRWIFCVLCTLVLILLVLALPFWNFHVTASVAESSIVSENAVSVVKVTQRRKVKAVEKPKPIEEKPVVKTTDAISSPKEKEEEKEEKIEEEAVEETEENFSDSTEESQEKESAGEFSENPIISEEVQKATTSYKSYALSRIAGKKQYPYSARSKGLEGKVRVRLVISPDGSISECRILQKCEHEILNEACLAAIKKSAPFKKMGEGMNAMTLTFVMDFSLK